MLKCIDCGEIFDEDEAVMERVCWEDYYGVSGSFPNKNYGSVGTCPHCGSMYIDDYVEEEDDESEE